MPSQVRMPRYVSARNSGQWDDIIRGLITAGKHGQEHTYFGITSEDRAHEVYRKLRTAATHQGVGRKVYWNQCNGCEQGGNDCRYHVLFTIYDMDDARAYKAQQASNRQAPARQ